MSGVPSDPSTGEGTDPRADTGGPVIETEGPVAEPDGRAAEPDGRAAEPVDTFPPTLREVMLRGRWLAMLGLCLLVAGIFAWLGQWQLGRAIDSDPPPPGATEVVRPIDEVVEPGEYLAEPLVGQRVEVSGVWVPDDFLVVSSRFNDDVEGYWVTGQLRVDAASTGSATTGGGSETADGDQTAAPTSIAVAIGWASSPAEAAAAIDQLEWDASLPEPATVTVTGRIISDEGPRTPPKDADPLTMTRMSPAALLGQWHDIEGLDVYRPYLASQVAPRGLIDISSPPPAEASAVNWLNIFYAIEWAVFAGFAFYLWYRLARDAWERELEELEEAAGGA